MTYKPVLNGEWVTPLMSGFMWACCDCHLAHRIQFTVVRQGKRNTVMFRAWRDNRVTAALRRKKKKGKQ